MSQCHRSEYPWRDCLSLVLFRCCSRVGTGIRTKETVRRPGLVCNQHCLTRAMRQIMPPTSRALMPPGKASGFLSWHHGTAYSTGDPGENDLQDHSREAGRRAPPAEPRTQMPPPVLRLSLVADGIPKGIRSPGLLSKSHPRSDPCG